MIAGQLIVAYPVNRQSFKPLLYRSFGLTCSSKIRIKNELCRLRAMTLNISHSIVFPRTYSIPGIVADGGERRRVWHDVHLIGDYPFRLLLGKYYELIDIMLLCTTHFFPAVAHDLLFHPEHAEVVE